MRKQLGVFAFVIIALFVFSGTASALQVNAVHVNVVYDNGETVQFETTAETVGELLEIENIIINENDVLNKQKSDVLTEGFTISISKSFNVYVLVNNQPDYEMTSVATTKKILAAFAESYGKQTKAKYIFDKEYANEFVYENEIIHLGTKETKVETSTKEIEFKTIYKDNKNVTKGETKVLTAGVKGVSTVKEKVSYEFGDEISRKLISKVTTTKPINEVIERGTKVENKVEGKVDSSEIPAYSKKITMNSTAYTDDYASTGKSPGDKYFGICATGMKAQVGVVAVDPKVIPLYTKLYIEGYGFAVAGDTGGAIKGNKIDLFFDTASEVNDHGRRNVKVYILEDQEKDYITLK